MRVAPPMSMARPITRLEVRRVIYTRNAIEALNRQLCKAIKTKGSFPNESGRLRWS